jgi:hypothetical protein
MVVHYHSNGAIFVRVSNGFHLKDLHDVNAPTPADGQVLTWVDANDRWEAAAAQQPNTFGTIAVGAQSVVADSVNDTLTLIAGTNITISANAGTDEITISASGGGGGSTASFIEQNTPNAKGSVNTNVLRFSNAVKTVGSDITYQASATDGDSYRINTAGRYMVSFQMRTAGTAYYGIKRSAVIDNTFNFNTGNWFGIINGNTFGSCGYMIDCAVDDLIYFLSTEAADNTLSKMTITGPF